MLPALLLLSHCDKIPKFGAETEGEEASGELVRDLKPTEFDTFTAIKGKLVLVDFHADWCGPCKTLAPKLKTVAEEHDGEVIIGKINVDDAKNLAARLGVSGIPDVRMFRNGTQVDRFVGDIPTGNIRAKVQAQMTLLQMASEQGETDEEGAPAAEPIQRMDKDWMPEGLQKR